MKLRKCAQLPTNQLVAILQANIHHHDLVVSLCPSRHDPSKHHHCHLQLIGAHETRPHPFQHFACLHEVATANVPANDSAIKIPHSKYCTVTKVYTYDLRTTLAMRGAGGCLTTKKGAWCGAVLARWGAFFVDLFHFLLLFVTFFYCS
jgi:hypothetical protein